MKEELYHIALDDYEHGVVIRSLNDKKTDLKKEGKSTDAVDDLIIKIGHAPRRKFKVVEKESCRESRQQQAVCDNLCGNRDYSRCVARLIDSAVCQGRSAGDTAEPFDGIQ